MNDEHGSVFKEKGFFNLSTLWMFIYGGLGLWLTLKVFRAIVQGHAELLFWKFNRDGHERSYWCWMGAGMLLSLVLFLASLKCFLGPLGNFY